MAKVTALALALQLLSLLASGLWITCSVILFIPVDLVRCLLSLFGVKFSKEEQGIQFYEGSIEHTRRKPAAHKFK